MSVTFFTIDGDKDAKGILRTHFRLDTGIKHAKADGSVVDEVLTGHVNESFLRDKDNKKAYDTYIAERDAKPVKEEIKPQDEAVFGEGK